MTPVHPNIGGLDASLRLLVAALLLVVTALVPRAMPDGFLTFLFLGLAFAVYLALTALSRLDWLYLGLGWSTARGP